MKQTIYISLIVFFTLGTSFNCFCQTGYKAINRAEKLMKKGDLKKALKVLNRAENMNYGFCGNAKLQAIHTIDSLKFVIHFKNKDYDQARSSLDSIIWFGKRPDLDMLKLKTYQEEFGTSYINNNIGQGIKNAYVECHDIYCYGIIPLKKGEFLKFKIYHNSSSYLFEDDTNKKRTMWVDEFLNSEVYQIIKQSK